MLTTVRDGKKVAPTCVDCGCRLNILEIEGMKFAHHFMHDYDNERDAREHPCTSLGKVWSITKVGSK